MPQAAFLFSIAGLSLSLAGFSGLVAAFKRGAPLNPIDAFRLRELPEMALATTFLAVLTIPLIDALHNEVVTIQIASGLAMLFTVAHVLRLVTRVRQIGISQSTGKQLLVTLANVLLLVTGAVSLGLGTPTAYEWLLVFMLARPMLAFVLVLTEIAPG
ncbi:MAG TPA: hypothetical protein VEN12_08450 [Verrucomicrobiae bacterium]|nr:hypothetical protein [Verrucomicrobiae bacterium]